MKRLTHFLARLYPASWRKRYGDEFEALVEDAKPTWRHAVDVFRGAIKMQATTWTFSRIVLASVIAGALLSQAISLLLPAHYVSQILIQAKPGDESSVRLLNDLEQSVLSPESLASIIQTHNLYPRDRARKTLGEVVENMRKSIRVNPIHPNKEVIAFVVGFDYADGRVAQEVTNEIADRFIVGNYRAAENRARENRPRDSHLLLAALDPASLPVKPVAPNRISIAVVGVFAGLLAGIALSIVNRWRRAAAGLRAP